jgi:hypothetical protein
LSDCHACIEKQNAHLPVINVFQQLSYQFFYALYIIFN